MGTATTRDDEDDGRLLDGFRDRLRDKMIRVRFHGATGEPLPGQLELLEDKVTLVWTNTNRVRLFQQRTAVVKIDDVTSVRDGRQTANFVRTIKYVASEDLPENDDRCLSLCCQVSDSPEQSAVSLPLVSAGTRINSFDIEFEDHKTRQIARSFFLAEANLSGTIDLCCDENDIPVPSGWPTRCYQLLTHPSFQLFVLISVIVNMLYIALKPFIFDDDQLQLVTTKSKMTVNMSPIEVALLSVLTMEQVTKIVALEGIRPVIRQKWDCFDFLVVLISWLAMIPSSSLAGFNMLSLRIFRGVRMLKYWKGFHEILETFLLSLPMAGNALLCYCYYLFLFAILGMYLFNDSMSHRCAVLQPIGTTSSAAATVTSNGMEYIAAFPGHFCRVGDSSCKSPQECIRMPPPNNGYTGFHSFQASFLTVFLSSLRAGFGTSMDGAVQATSYFSIFYFMGFVVFVSYMILSLYVGIVRGSYIEVTIRRAAKIEAQKQHREDYLKKQRVQFPSPTAKVPDVLQVAIDKWNDFRLRARDTLLQSPLFTPVSDPDDAFMSRFRLGQHRLFYLVEPESLLMDKIRAISDSLFFEHLMNLVVFLNSIMFAMEYHGMTQTYAARLYTVENVLIFVYAAEFVIICASAGGLVNYLKNPWNRLDFIILTSAFIEFICLAASLLLYSESYTRAIFVLRLFRLVRPFRVVRKKNELLLVLDAVLASVPAFLSLVTFHVLINSVFAVVGMNLFGGKFPVSMRSNFNTFGDSMLTLFKISCGGNIWPIFHAGLQATSFTVALMYFMAFFTLCVYIVLNFMLVVLLRNFAMKEDERVKTLGDQFQDRMLVMQRIHHFDEYMFLQDFSELYQNDIMYATLSGSAEKRAKLQMSATEEIKSRLLRVLPVSDFLRVKGYSRGIGVSRQKGVRYSRLDATSPNGKRTSLNPSGEDNVLTTDETSYSPDTGFVSRVKNMVRRFFGGEWLTSDVSLFLFPLNSRFRLICKRLEKETDKYIFSAIVFRTVLLTIQSPLYSSMIQEFTLLIDIIFALVLLFEFTIKVIARGFLFTPNSYLSNPWNQINMVALMACSLLLLLPHSTMISIFRLGRAFGPVRVFYRVKTFRVITEALKQSARQIFYCVVIALFVFYSFATLGMQFFAGKFSFCNDPLVSSRVQCEGFFWNTKTGILMPRVWGNLAGMHFDNIGGAMSSVFVLVTKKGWLPVLNLAMDIVDSDHQPVQNASAYFALFFVSFIFFSRFYMLKMFAGIIMNNFRCYNGTLLLTNLQLIWMRNKQAIVAMRPKYPLPRNKIMKKAQIYVQSRCFRVFISSIVLLHTTLLAWYRSPIGRVVTDDLDDDPSNNTAGVWWCHYVFSTIYAIDAITYVVSVGWRDFLMNGFTWRTTNSVTAFIMLFGPLLSDSPVILVLGMTRAFDWKHMAVVFDRFYTVRTLFETLLASVRLILKVTLVLAYALFVFAIVAMQLFSETRWNYGLDSNMNYITFPNAFATFTKFMAGEDWYDTHQACSVSAPKCTTAGFFLSARHASDCGSPFFSLFFYDTFYILVVLILQNLYVATMVDTYVSTSAVGEHKDKSIQLLGFKSADLKHFQAMWSDFDNNVLGYLHKKHLLSFLTRLKAPLGLGTHHDMLQALTNEDTPPAAIEALKLAVHQQRREAFHDIEARICELTYRLRVIQDDHLATDYSYPSSMIRFTDLLLVLTGRIVPLESLTVQEKVDELAIRGYVHRHRQAVRIQSVFRMYRVLRRKRNRSPRSLKRTTSQLSLVKLFPPPVAAQDDARAASPVLQSILATSDVPSSSAPELVVADPQPAVETVPLHPSEIAFVPPIERTGSSGLRLPPAMLRAPTRASSAPAKLQLAYEGNL